MFLNRLKLSRRRYQYYLILFVIIGVIGYKYKFEPKINSEGSRIILWWTDFVTFNHRRTCGHIECFFTNNRSYYEHPQLQAILFYASNMNTTNFPLPRYSHHLWGLLHEESPKNLPFIMYDATLSLFNYTATFSRHSDLPLTNMYLGNLDELISEKYVVPIAEKNRLQQEEGLAPVLYIQSICDTMSKRDEFVKDLMAHVKVDAFGACLNNKKLPFSLADDYYSKINTEEFYKFIARYKFVIAYENSVCTDYITEKLWRPLIVGTVPIYYGSPQIQDWLPNKNSAILVDDFSSVQQLTMFITSLNNNDSEYVKYLDHKMNKNNPISNNELVELINQRNREKPFEFLEAFECMMCTVPRNPDTVKTANVKHYNCADQALNYPKMLNDRIKSEPDDWLDIIKAGKCEARLIHDLVMYNRSFTDSEFTAMLIHRLNADYC